MKRIIFYFFLIPAFAYPCFGQNSWTQTSTPPNGSVWSLAVIGTNIFATSSSINSGGVYFSADDGNTWIRRNGAYPDMQAFSLVVSGTDLFVGTGSVFGAGVYKSSDQGLSWINITPVGFNPGSTVRSLLVDGGKLYMGTAGASQGIFKADLAGINSSSWSTFNTGLPPTSMAIAEIRDLKISGGNIFAATYFHGIWVSPVSSPNWTATSGITAPANYISSLSFMGPVFFAGNAAFPPVLYRSLDNGANWLPASTPIFNDKGVYALLNDGNIIYAGTEGAGVLTSSDNGVSWRDFNWGFKDALNNWYCNSINVRSLIFKGGAIYAGTDCGVWKREAAILPATLLSFTAEKVNGNSKLVWKTAPGSTAIQFDIERSNDGVLFKKIAERNAVPATTEYYYSEKTAGLDINTGTVFYRLKLILPDGSYSYSAIRSIKVLPGSGSEEAGFSIFPNPAKNSITLAVDPGQVGSVFRITNTTGQNVLKGKLSNTNTIVDISRFGPGVYYLQIGNKFRLFQKVSDQ